MAALNNSQDLRTPLGTRDLSQNDVNIRNYIFNIARQCFEKRNAIELDTPVVELFSLVKNLYGEEFNKLVYTLDDGADKLILRYDQTVPLARYIAMNGLKKLRRYQIGKVYRKDEPQISKGRLREFYQCDFDIVGDDQNTGIYDIEILELLVDLLDKLLGSNTYTIQINQRNILYAVLASFGIDESLFGTISASLDKLDKVSLDCVKKELVSKKVSDEAIEKIEKFVTDTLQLVKNNNFMETLASLKMNNYVSVEIYNSLETMFNTFASLNIANNFVLNPILCRGLDYYTGIIFEATYNDKTLMETTICAGGRYDKMIGKFSNQGDVPAIGLSIGVERIATILDKKNIVQPKNKADVYIASIGKNAVKEMVQERVKLCLELRKLGLNAMMSHLSDPTMRSQFDDVFNNNIPYMVVIGTNEIKNNQLTIKEVATKVQTIYDKKDGIALLLNSLNK